MVKSFDPSLTALKSDLHSCAVGSLYRADSERLEGFLTPRVRETEGRIPMRLEDAQDDPAYFERDAAQDSPFARRGLDKECNLGQSLQ